MSNEIRNGEKEMSITEAVQNAVVYGPINKNIACEILEKHGIVLKRKQWHSFYFLDDDHAMRRFRANIDEWKCLIVKIEDGSIMGIKR